MNRRELLGAAMALLVAPRAPAQVRSRTPRIGVLNFGSPPASGAPPESIVRHLAALGYVEGAHIHFERRYAGGNRHRYPELASELLRTSVDLIFTPGSDVARAFAAASPGVPVVFVVSDDPVAAGLVRSLARPGGRFTGISLMSPELGGKRLEFLKEALPAVTRIAVLYDQSHESYLSQMRIPAERAGIALTPIQFEGVADFAPAFSAAKHAKADAMFVAPNRFTLAYAAKLAELSIQHRIPAISPYDTFAVAGGLMSYGPILDDAVARAAAFIDKILKGANPATLPVEQPPRIALVVNLRTAKSLGMTMPPSLLLRADRVID